MPFQMDIWRGFSADVCDPSKKIQRIQSSADPIDPCDRCINRYVHHKSALLVRDFPGLFGCGR